MLTQIESLIEEFNRTTHGSTDLGKDTIYVKAKGSENYVPLKQLAKKIEEFKSADQLLKLGYAYSAYNYVEESEFLNWYQKQFGKRLSMREQQEVNVLQITEDKEIFDSLSMIHKCYELLREQNILINSKNLPTQLGEWYAKTIFGLKQVKSTSQRGFDFMLGTHRVEVKVHWADVPSPKGVRLKKSMINLADHVIIIYLGRNFLIRELCFLDSEFVLRKFDSKGHTLFLKDPEVSPYFFSKSEKQLYRVVNKSALMRFASPNLAMKLDGRI